MKDLQFSIGRLTSRVKSQVARKNPLQDQDARALNLWLFEERNQLALSRTKAYQQGETNRAFLEWVQEDLDKNQDKQAYCTDIQDIGSTLYDLLCKQSELENQYAERYILYRRALKSLRDREKELSNTREKKQSLQERVDRLSKSNPSSKKVQDLMEELSQLQLESQETETAEFKRFILKEAFHLRFNALQEYAEKLAILAGYGKFITDLLDVDTHASSNSDMILKDALLTIDHWTPKDQRETSGVEDLVHHEMDDEHEDAVLLTDTELEKRYIERQEEPASDLEKQKARTTLEADSSSTSTENKNYSNDIYDLFIRRMSLKKTPQTHRTYEAFQSQYGITFNDEKREFYDEMPPPSYSNVDDGVYAADMKEKKNITPKG